MVSMVSMVSGFIAQSRDENIDTPKYFAVNTKYSTIDRTWTLTSGKLQKLAL